MKYTKTDCGCEVTLTDVVAEKLKLDGGVVKKVHAVKVKRCKECQIYIDERNLLIPKALEIAYGIHGHREGLDENEVIEWANKWNRTYHETMNMLAKDL